MSASIRTLLASRPLRIAVAVLASYALLGLLLAPYLVERAVQQYARERLQATAHVGAVRINPFLLTCDIEQFALAARDGRPIAAFAHLQADLQAASALRGAWHLASVAVDGLELSIERGREGTWNFAPPTARAGAAETDRVLPALHVARIEVAGQMSYRDAAAPATLEIAPFALTVERLSTRDPAPAAVRLEAQLGGGGTLRLQGTLALAAPAVEAKVSIDGLPARTAWPFLRDRLRLAGIDGTFDLTGDLHLSSAKGGTAMRVSGLSVRAAGLRLRDAGAPAPLLALQSVELSGARIDWSARTVEIPKAALARGRFRLAIAQDGSVDWAQVLRKRPAEDRGAPWRFTLADVRLSAIQAAIEDRHRAAPVALAIGDFGARLKLALVTGTAGVKLHAPRIDAARASVQAIGADAPALALAAVQAGDLHLDGAARTVSVETLEVDGGSARLVRTVAGIHLAQLPPVMASAPDPSPAGAAPAPAWQVRVEALRLRGIAAALADERAAPATVIEADLTDAQVSGIGAGTPVGFDASLRLHAGGEVAAGGTLETDRRARLRLEAQEVNLAALQPLLAAHAPLTLRTGVLSGSAQIDHVPVAGASPAASVTATATATVEDLLLVDTGTAERFLACRSVTAAGIRWHGAPARLAIEDLRLVGPVTQVLIFPDRRLNLIETFRRGDPVPSETAPKPPLAFDIARVRISRGHVGFADQSLMLPFATDIRDFRGTVTGIISESGRLAEVALQGAVEQYGEVKVTGTLAPLAPSRSMDLRAVFTNVEMPRLTPYSVTFAGREIERGNMSLNLEYRIADGKLAGDNVAVLDQFTLGKRVDSRDALDLPLDLAVALLTDSRGRIDLAIPVSGDLDNPTFAIGKVVGQAIARALGKLVTAPFSALASLLGGGDSQRYESVVFEPGSAALAPPQRGRLAELGKALAQRPQLRIRIAGAYDTARDGEALRNGQVQRAVAAELELAEDEGEGAAPVVFDEARTQRALETLYERRAGDGAVDEFQVRYEAQAGKPADRVGAIMALLGRASEDTAFYRALYADLVRLEPLPDAALVELAQRRARETAAELAREGAVAPERILTAEPKAARGTPQDGVHTALELVHAPG
ncbi:MAG: DUF748 domain-containing protein [Gammaproteobacteria bacterium]